jgi:hypothetical protein
MCQLALRCRSSTTTTCHPIRVAPISRLLPLATRTIAKRMWLRMSSGTECQVDLVKLCHAHLMHSTEKKDRCFDESSLWVDDAVEREKLSVHLSLVGLLQTTCFEKEPCRNGIVSTFEAFTSSTMASKSCQYMIYTESCHRTDSTYDRKVMFRCHRLVDEVLCRACPQRRISCAATNPTHASSATF